MNKISQDILAIMQKHDITNISQLLEHKITSESTLRRNINNLCDNGFLQKSYGGHLKLVDQDKISIKDEFKEKLNHLNKIKLAKICADLIEDDSTIFIDNGTTVRFILRFIRSKNVTIYTNGYNHIKLAQEYNLDLRLIPGQIIYKEAAIVGGDALYFLSQINFDLVFIGANGFDPEFGVTTPLFDEMQLKKMALSRSEKSYFVVDVSKFKKRTQHKISDFSTYPVITLT